MLHPDSKDQVDPRLEEFVDALAEAFVADYFRQIEAEKQAKEAHAPTDC